MIRRIKRLLPKSTRGKAAGFSLLVVVFVGLFGWKWALVSWRIRSARELLNAGDIEQALARLETAESLQPERAELLYLLAKAHRRADQYDRFTEYLERAEAAGWSADDLRTQRYLALVQIGQFDRAEPFLEETVKSGASDELAEEFYEAKAKGCLRTYRLIDARICLNYWLEWKPHAIRPRLWLADVHTRVNDWKAAVAEYRKVLQSDPEHPEANLRLGDCLLHLHQAREALAHYRKVLARRPDHVAARIGRAKCERQLALVEDSAATFAGLLKLDLSNSQRVDVLVELAQIKFRDERDPEAAIRLLKEAERIAPQHEPMHATLAAAYRRTGREELAGKHEKRAKESQARLDRLVEITRKIVHSPKNADLRYQAGQIYMEQGMHAAGAGWMRTALLLNPHHQPARKALAQYEAETNSRSSNTQNEKRLGALQP